MLTGLAPVAVLTATPLISVLATDSFDPVTWLVNYGVAGVVLALLVTGRLRSKQEVDGLTRQVAEAEERARQAAIALQAMMQQVTTHTLPQLSQITRVVESLPERKESDLMNRLEDLARRIEAAEGGSHGDG